MERAFPGLPNARWVALRLLDGDERIVEALRSGELGELSDASASLLQPVEAPLALRRMAADGTHPQRLSCPPARELSAYQTGSCIAE